MSKPGKLVRDKTQTFGLDSHGIVLDLGCGTGHLAIPSAARSRAVVPAALLGP